MPPFFEAFIVPAIAAGVGAYFAAYLARKGEARARKEDFAEIRLQLQQTTKDTEEIKATLASREWLTQQQWEKRETFYTSLLSELHKLRVSMEDCHEFYVNPHQPPNVVHDDAHIRDDPAYIKSMKEGRKAMDCVREHMGAASIYLSLSSNKELDKLRSKIEDARYHANHTLEYLEIALKAASVAFVQVRSEAFQDLSLPDTEAK